MNASTLAALLLTLLSASCATQTDMTRAEAIALSAVVAHNQKGNDQ